MKKVLLINSPIFDRKVADKEDYLPPYGLGYIASELEKYFNVKLIDAVNNNYTVDEILNIIYEEKPDAVGINIFSVNFEIVKKIIENCSIKTKFIVGGKSTRFLYNDIIKFNTENEINVTIGEGEYITKDIVNGCVLEKSIVDVNNRCVYLVNKDSKYFPHNLDKLNLNREIFKNRAILNPYVELEEAIVTSRECLYNCAFCGGARSLNSDVTVRTRSMDNIIKELQYISDCNPDTESIRILDDLFLKNRNSIIDAINIFKNFSFNWRAMSHIMSLKGNEDLFLDLLDSGCRELEIGIESGSDKIRNEIHKVGSVENIKEVIKKVLDSGINVKGYVMYGLPGETVEDAYKTLDLITELVDYSKNSLGTFRSSAFQFRPYHGTELYNKINQNIKYSHNDNLNGMSGRNQFNFTAGNFSDCSDELIEELVIKTNGYGEELDDVKKSK
jgi:radical SAM superfamily enzyme YgiQ (UPF0313 family)